MPEVNVQLSPPVTQCHNGGEWYLENRKRWRLACNFSLGRWIAISASRSKVYKDGEQSMEDLLEINWRFQHAN